jgi:hypothetical protein
MAPRKPKKNIGDQVGGWLGGAAKGVGRAAAQNPIVAQNIKYGKAVMAGPSALAKTVAIDLASAATGVAAAKVAGKVVTAAGKVLGNPRKSSTVVYHSTPMSSPGAPHLRGGNPNFHAGTEMSAADRAYIFDKGFSKSRQVESPYVIHRYEIKKSAPTDPRMMVDNVTESTGTDFVQNVEKQSINKIRTYINEFEDPGSISRLVPKSLLDTKAVKYSGSTVVPARSPAVRKAPSQIGKSLNNPYTTPADVAAKKISDTISRNQNIAATAGVVVPKKKGRGGGAKKR